MNKISFSYTKHQTPRGAKADAERGGKSYLIKNVSEMRLTYQVRMLAYMAQLRGGLLVVQLPKASRVHASLRDFVGEFGKFVKIERV